jgi:hypothetical protein
MVQEGSRKTAEGRTVRLTNPRRYTSLRAEEL